MLRYILVMFGFVGLSAAHVQLTGAVFSQFFAKAVGTSGEERVRCMIQTTDQGFALAGYTMPEYPPATDEDVFVVKLNPDGSLAWEKRYRGSGHECAYTILQTTDGGLAVAGYTWSFGADSSDILLMKLNPDGSVAWARRYGGSGQDYCYSMTLTSDGGFAIAGVTTSFTDPTADVLVLKVNSNGSLAWARTFGRLYWYDDASSIIQTSDGGYMLAGRTDGWASDKSDVLMLKLNADGSLAWARAFGTTSADLAYSVIQTADGGYAVAGHTDTALFANSAFLVLKLNSNGSLVWAKTYEESDANNGYEFMAWSIIKTLDGGYMVSGYGFLFGTGLGDQWIMLKLNPDGSIAWSRMFGDGDMDTRYAVRQSVVQTPEGDYVLTGRSDCWIIPQPPWSWGDFVVLKMDSDGNYPKPCFLEPYLMVDMTLSLGTFSFSNGATRSLSTASVNPTVSSPGFTVIDICEEPVYGGDVETPYGPQPGITCSPMSGGVLFNSPGSLPIKMYSSGGMLVYSGELAKGENRITLETGVYLWKAGAYKGKAVVR